MRTTTEINFGFNGVLYKATAELLPVRPPFLRIYNFSPKLLTGEQELSFEYLKQDNKYTFPALSIDQMALAGSMLAATYEAFQGAGVLLNR